MIKSIDTEHLRFIKNEHFFKYAQIYLNISANYTQQIMEYGLELDKPDPLTAQRKRDSLLQMKAQFRNNNHSIVHRWISSACVACQKGEQTRSMFISLKCHRQCFFCFNPNQEDYAKYRSENRNLEEELRLEYKKGHKLSHIALTGGEPLLHQEEMLSFFRTAKELWPKIHTRLYTSGDFLNDNLLLELKHSGLDEIRFSIKMEDPTPIVEEVYERIALSQEYIPHVMVEMPVQPDHFETMKDVLLRLNSLRITGINLLEFCFPFNNVSDFKRKGYKIKNPPFHVLYNFWYAGGLPISKSEDTCLALMEFALDQKLEIGVHYCSLENKQTGQVYQQNNGQKVAPYLLFSPTDYYFKFAKVFGPDIEPVKKILKKKNISNFQINRDYDFLEFHVHHVKHLKSLDVEIALCYHIMEKREDAHYLRELKVDYTTPQTFNEKLDL